MGEMHSTKQANSAPIYHLWHKPRSTRCPYVLSKAESGFHQKYRTPVQMGETNNPNIQIEELTQQKTLQWITEPHLGGKALQSSLSSRPCHGTVRLSTSPNQPGLKHLQCEGWDIKLLQDNRLCTSFCVCFLDFIQFIQDKIFSSTEAAFCDMILLRKKKVITRKWHVQRTFFKSLFSSLFYILMAFDLLFLYFTSCC